jgi:VWFA-related protein
MGGSIQAKRIRSILDEELVGENMVSQNKAGETKTGENKILQITVLLALLLLATPAAVQNLNGGKSGSGRASQAPGGRQLHISNRESTPLFKGQQGKQKTEIHFDPATRMVTVKLLVQDANGYFIPNIRRDNFVVYENGVRQQNATVEIEHAPVKIGLLMEFGGRAQALNRLMGPEISHASQQLLDELGQEDKIAVWKYNDKVEKLADFSQARDTLDRLFQGLGTPEFSDTNLYDALIYTIEQMRTVTGRKAIALISSGVDTFSKAKYADAMRAAQETDTPIYVISLAPILRHNAEIYESTSPLARIDWNKVERELQGLAKVSGGRAYSPESTIALSSTYDDMMENLKVRYVISYQSSDDRDLSSPRAVRVELVDPDTGGPLQIVDEKGQRARASVVVQDSYVPNNASGG